MRFFNNTIVLLILSLTIAGASSADIMTTPPNSLTAPNSEGKCVITSDTKCKRINNSNICVALESSINEHDSHGGQCGVNHVVGSCVYDEVINDCKIEFIGKPCNGWTNPPNYKSCECLCKSADGSVLRTADVHSTKILETKNCQTDVIIVGFACDGYTDSQIEESEDGSPIYNGPKTQGVYSCADEISIEEPQEAPAN